MKIIERRFWVRAALTAIESSLVPPERVTGARKSANCGAQLRIRLRMPGRKLYADLRASSSFSNM